MATAALEAKISTIAGLKEKFHLSREITGIVGCMLPAMELMDEQEQFTTSMTRDPDDTRLLHTYIHDLRGKLGDNARSPTYIFTEPRVGYRMAKP